MKPPPGFWRDDSAHKGSGGRLLVIGGSKGMVGAGALCANAAVVGGCGSVMWMVADSVTSAAVPLFTDGWVRPLPDGGSGHLLAGHVEDLLGLEPTALAIGPGLGQGAQQLGLVEGLLARFDGPSVIDADAINLLAGHAGTLASALGMTVVTPHPAEAARLTGAPDNTAETIAGLTGGVAVLKGARSVVAGPGDTWTQEEPAPVLATAGSGDVLTGLIGAQLARGIDAFEAARFAVWWHSEAGRWLAGELGGPQGAGASSVLDALVAVQQNGFE